MALAGEALELVFGQPALDDPDLRLNKATAYSWLLFAARGRINDWLGAPGLGEFLVFVEQQRGLPDQDRRAVERLIFDVFNDRATSRVNDVASVMLRDTCLWALWANGDDRLTSPLRLWEAFAGAKGQTTAETTALAAASELNWSKIR